MAQCNAIPRIIFDICCVVFSRAMGVAFLSFHDDDKQKVNFEKIWVKNPFKKFVKLTVKINIHKKKSQIVGIKAKR